MGSTNDELRDDFDPPQVALDPIVAAALAEDLLPLGDLTASLVPLEVTGHGSFIVRDHGVLAGTACLCEVARQVDPTIDVTLLSRDGDTVSPGLEIARIVGPVRSLLTAERTALNFLCHLSGVATLARRYVDLAKGANPKTRVLDTRKTTPGLRTLEKAAVRAGGAVNHRANLSEGVLIKDNHLLDVTIADGVAKALSRFPGRMVEVECERLDQVVEALAAGATIVMCDNMTPEEVKQAVEIVGSHPRGANKSCLVEASGRVNLETIAEYARAGADLVSVGAITHSSPILDIGLDFFS